MRLRTGDNRTRLNNNRVTPSISIPQLPLLGSGAQPDPQAQTYCPSDSEMQLPPLPHGILAQSSKKSCYNCPVRQSRPKHTAAQSCGHTIHSQARTRSVNISEVTQRSAGSRAPQLTHLEVAHQQCSRSRTHRVRITSEATINSAVSHTPCSVYLVRSSSAAQLAAHHSAQSSSVTRQRCSHSRTTACDIEQVTLSNVHTPLVSRQRHTVDRTTACTTSNVTRRSAVEHTPTA